MGISHLEVKPVVTGLFCVQQRKAVEYLEGSQRT